VVWEEVGAEVGVEEWVGDCSLMSGSHQDLQIW
jgi:hypothetical protein